jgi:hypothetical protein
MSTIKSKLQHYDWGPYYLVPSKAIQNYSGCVLLRTSFDRELLRKYLDGRGFSGSVVSVTNFWFYRKKSSLIWTKIGESYDIARNFPVKWDTTQIENGQYEIIGFMQAFVTNDHLIKRKLVTLGNGEYNKFGYMPVFVKKRLNKRVIAEQKIVEVAVEN